MEAHQSPGQTAQGVVRQAVQAGLQQGQKGPGQVEALFADTPFKIQAKAAGRELVELRPVRLESGLLGLGRQFQVAQGQAGSLGRAVAVR